MLRRLVLEHTGPAARLEFAPAPRVNLITGDNGLGKSFLLEAAWWVLTRTWHGEEAAPNASNGETASIAWEFDSATRRQEGQAPWVREAQEWRRAQGRPPNPGLVLYAAHDGSFSAWDPARNYRLYRRRDGSKSETRPSFRFSPSEVMWGLNDGNDVVCKGLVEDWVDWQRVDDPRFRLIDELLLQLGPPVDAGAPRLRAGPPTRPRFGDARDVPTIITPTGECVAVTLAAAGVMRLVRLVYLLAWSISEHQLAAKQLGLKPADQLILLLDEPETHLHPRWQRTILPSLLTALEAGWGDWRPKVQLLIATHAPLVLASMEPHFKPDSDALWKLDLHPPTGSTPSGVTLTRDPGYRRGDATMWLVSDVFDHTSPYSREAEETMQRVAAFMASPDPDRSGADMLRAELRAVLPDTDPFWLGVRAWYRSRGWSP
jgi:hypothetical protein